MAVVAVLALIWLAYHGGRLLRPRRTSVGPRREMPAASGLGALPAVVFLVPVWNGASDIAPFVRCFRALDLPGRTLVLVAGGDDGSYEEARRFVAPDIAVLRQRPGEGKQAALRKGWRRVPAPLVFLTDIDCRPDNASVLPLLAHVAAYPREVATGVVSPLPEQRHVPLVRMQWAVRQAGWPGAPRPVRGLDGRAIALHRDAVEASGGFSTPAPSGTDYVLARELVRHGRRLVEMPCAMPTRYPESRPEYVRKQARWLRNVIVWGLCYRQWRDAAAGGRTVALPFGLVCLLVAGLWFPPLLLVPPLLVAHAGLNRVHYSRQARIAATPGTVLAHIAADLLAGVLAFRQMLAGYDGWT